MGYGIAFKCLTCDVTCPGIGLRRSGGTTWVNTEGMGHVGSWLHEHLTQQCAVVVLNDETGLTLAAQRLQEKK
jgi:hypothetical protein